MNQQKAKYIDVRDSSIKSGSELSSGRRTRNKNLLSENLRVHRGKLRAIFCGLQLRYISSK